MSDTSAGPVVDGMSWIERLGMLRAAERMELPADWD